MSREIDTWIRSLEKKGWRVARTKKNHFRLDSPDGREVVHTGGTPSDHRSLKNAKARVARVERAALNREMKE